MPVIRTIPTQAETDLATFTILSNGEVVGGDVGIESIWVVKSVNRIPTARVVLFDGSVSRETFELSSGNLFLPGNEIEIKAGYHSDEDTIFKGIITKHSIQARKGRSGYLILELKDAAIKMTIGRKSKYFAELTDSDMIEELISGYGFDANVESTTVTHASLVQHHATDWDFMMTRAEVNGKLVLVDDGKVAVKAPDLAADPIVELAYGYNVYEFEAGLDARDQFAAVKSSAWDLANQEIVEGEGDDPGLPEQGNLATSDLASVAGPEEFLLKHSGRVKDAELKAWSDAQLLRSRLAKIRGTVKIQGFSDIKPGHVIQLAGFGDRMNGPAFVSSVSHRVTNDSDWFTEIEFGLQKDWFVNLYNDIVDKPAGGLIPSVNGLQIGVVTNIHEDPDGEERIKVRLPIIDSENEGVWARLATLNAAQDRGWVFRPEIEDEVIVGFLNDDPRDPVILGSLFSSAKASPLPPEEENTQKGVVTRSGMKFLFDDDKVSVTIETPNGNTIVVSDDEGSINIEDENKNKFTLSSDGVTLESAADIKIKASGDINLEGVNINLKSQAQLKAEGSAGAELSSSGQTVVKGSIVMIN
ncbi:type VI secretion system tip protein VgrG [Mangrovibacterium diazotrophicum]|uniref:Rhs element Vgr protein n=1 Tax=Mangrovibacterium diazotrophicum TaxID=1261403 RepID=A0A419VYX4_9BACT|nr:type VI secretion system tip protein VgrG [Mangrovibacterium diazotrophicum]RKD88364.1 Rhs element Vgr protein [Mangrovibacterium diazotrophicum]